MPPRLRRGAGAAISHQTFDCRSSRSHVCIARCNAVLDEVDADTPPSSSHRRISPRLSSASGEEDVEQALQLLLRADRPVIIAGNGVHMAKAYGELRSLAEFLGAPVASSAKARALFRRITPWRSD